ncbi:ribosome small subunit-dependent GTPase A [Hydrotalea sandarakina]|jgi:ribosome biogenesis GTPase|uniref:Small ribosomal subunit biogenesis GTPase RsgA n=2 Tax=Hydrotalea TaxID=1004300 RepID=A0A2W7RKA1_9BACT|nr:ribosome small subunit-dependent GTPase A [Hydrotalea sandarakina]PZX59426.1 ribosome biogenesis GTPase [Hydrotalea sandarakina]
MKATVYKSTGSWYQVKADDGRFYAARIKGVFKIEGFTSTNPIAVGDVVNISIEPGPEQHAVIEAIEPRHNYVIRQSPHHRKHHHIIAANIDQSILFITLKQPRTSQGFIDRFLVACEMYHVPAILVFNKADIYREKEMQQYEQLHDLYTQIGYRVLLCSMVTQQNIAELKALLQQKISLISGHSGVGKSTFIQQLFPDLSLKTLAVSEWSGKGMHSTTFAEMFDLPDGGKLIDTPGIRELALVDISKQELSHYFPEMRERITQCQFNNCLHMYEPGCAVKQAVDAGEIAEERYFSYLKLLEEIDENTWA